MARAPDVDRWTGHPAAYIARVADEVANAVFDERTGRAMGDENGTGTGSVRDTFAGMLSELEDVATSLTTRQAALARELASVEAELHRVEEVRRLMSGEPKKPAAKKKPPSQQYTPSPEVQEKIARVLTWARERGDEFTGGDAAEFLGQPSQSIGPLLAGMARRDQLRVRAEGNRRFYSVSA
jgi:hypothetical protein